MRRMFVILPLLPGLLLATALSAQWQPVSLSREPPNRSLLNGKWFNGQSLFSPVESPVRFSATTYSASK